MSAITPPQRDSRTDVELVAASRAGEDRAFEVLYDRYRRRITAYVHSMVGDWARAEDITQDVFVSALRRLRTSDQPIVFKPWVFEIAKNASIDQYRRARRAEEVPLSEGADELRPGENAALAAPEPTPDAAAEVGQQIEHLRGAFNDLSDSHHRILVLRELEGRSYREIGERMNLTRPGVESTLFRARRRLTEEYTALATGARCRRVRGQFAAMLEDEAGVRERRRVERHLAWCRTCRVDARRAGLDTSEFVRHGLSRIGAFLPLPLLLHRGAATGDALARSAAGAPGLADQVAGGWKAAAAALTLIAASTGAGMVSQAPDAFAGPEHRLQPPAETVPAPPAAPPASAVPRTFRAQPERPPIARRIPAPVAPRPSARMLRIPATSSIAGAALTRLSRSAEAGPNATLSDSPGPGGSGTSPEGSGGAAGGTTGSTAGPGRGGRGGTGIAPLTAPVQGALGSVAPGASGAAGTVDETLSGVDSVAGDAVGTVRQVLDGVTGTTRGLLDRR